MALGLVVESWGNATRFVLRSKNNIKSLNSLKIACCQNGVLCTSSLSITSKTWKISLYREEKSKKKVFSAEPGCVKVKLSTPKTAYERGVRVEESSVCGTAGVLMISVPR